MNFGAFLKIALGIGRTLVPAIGAVEDAIKGLKAGASKKDSVLAIVKAIPEIAEAVSQKDIVDQVLFDEAISELNDGYVKLLNSLKK